MRLYLIRHAQSTNNALTNMRHRVQDPDLTDLGYRQADALADYLLNNTHELPDDGYRITHLYCSPMYRSLLTAQPVAAQLELKTEVWVDVHEYGGIFLEDPDGVFTGYPGMTRPQILAKFPDYLLPDLVSDAGWWDSALGQEDAPRFISRAIKVALALNERRATDDHIAIIAHAAFLDALTKALLNQLPLKPRAMFYAHYNTGITRFDFDDEMDNMRLHYLNRTEHLPPQMRSW